MTAGRRVSAIAIRFVENIALQGPSCESHAMT